MNIDVNAALRISSILSHGVEGEANTNKEYFNELRKDWRKEINDIEALLSIK